MKKRSPEASNIFFRVRHRTGLPKGKGDPVFIFYEGERSKQVMKGGKGEGRLFYVVFDGFVGLTDDKVSFVF